MLAVSLVFAFDSGATFSSLGVVLFTMAKDLGWSHADAGMSFSLLGLACGLSSPVPPWLMRRIGTRATVTLGVAVLATGALLASVTQNLWTFYAATVLLGTGFTLSGNVPAIFLLASWFPQRSARMIGLYLMLGALGGMVAPPLAQTMLGASGNWRVHWLALAIIAAVMTVICYVLIRNPPGEMHARSSAVIAAERDKAAESSKAAQRSPQFILITLAYIAITASATTMHSATVAHLDQLGITRIVAAFLLGIVGASSALSKGAGGWLGELVSSRRLLIAALALAALGMLLLGHAETALMGYAFAICFGLGWGGTYVATHVLLVEAFGRPLSASLLSAAHLWSTIATAGPFLAGLVADRFGSFAPIFWFYAASLVALTIAVALLRMPGADSAVRSTHQPA